MLSVELLKFAMAFGKSEDLFCRQYDDTTIVKNPYLLQNRGVI